MSGSNGGTPKHRNPLDTPMIRQYLELKASVTSQHQDCFLFFRMGDFYEMFLDDARAAAPLLGITLTSRNKGNPDEVPLCGFPHHQLEEYVNIMVAHGHKVAICEQVEVPNEKIFRREITRVVTPGLCAGYDRSGDDRTARYLAALYVGEKGSDTSMLGVGLAYADLSTGEFKVTEFFVDPPHLVKKVQDELERFCPAEILIAVDQLPLWGGFFENASYPMTLKPRAAFENAEKTLASYFGDPGILQIFNLSKMPLAMACAGAITQYLQATQVKGVAHMRWISPFSTSEIMAIDAFSRRNLELSRNLYDLSRRDTLLELLDDCSTKMGSRLLEKWLHAPLCDKDAIDARLDSVQAWLHVWENPNPDLMKCQENFASVRDLERLVARFGLNIAGPRDLVWLQESIVHALAIRSFCQRLNARLIGDLVSQIPEGMAALAEAIAQQIDLEKGSQQSKTKEGGFVRSGFHEELDQLRLLMQDHEAFIKHIEERERQKTGISNLKIKHNRVFGFYIEVTKSNLAQVPDYFIRKQTIVNGERFFLPELKELEEKLEGAQVRAQAIENEIFENLALRVRAETAHLQASASAIAQLDILFAFARMALSYHYCRPVMANDLQLSFKDLRHPVIERKLQKTAKRSTKFVANDVCLSAKGGAEQILLITGPNMAGKSTVMRQVALSVLMAQVGCFVPASQAHVGIVDAIFTRVGASDYLSLGQSTFMVEMQETANILRNATKKSLVILDEIGRGTSTDDGLSIAWAVAEYIHEHIGARTLFATHYHELAELPKKHSRVANYHLAVKEWNGEILFLRKLMKGSTNRSYGIEVAKLAGIPSIVIDRAKSVLAGLCSDGERVGRDRHQLNLFSSAPTKEFPISTDVIAKQLRQLDISHTSPIEALNILNQIKNDLKDLNDLLEGDRANAK